MSPTDYFAGAAFGGPACSAVAMRFPAPWADYSPAVSRATAMGE